MIFPRNICFYKDDSGQYDIFINSNTHPDMEEVRQCYECLKKYYSDLTETDIKIYNEEGKKLDEEHRQYMKKHYGSGGKAKPTEGYIYLIKSSGKYKIGRAISLSRIRSYRTENPNSIKVIVTKKVLDYVSAEKEILSCYSNDVVKGKEWLKLDKYKLQALITMINSYE